MLSDSLLATDIATAESIIDPTIKSQLNIVSTIFCFLIVCPFVNELGD